MAYMAVGWRSGKVYSQEQYKSEVFQWINRQEKQLSQSHGAKLLIPEPLVIVRVKA
ncbi:hypothetical protein ACPD8N_00695 [Lacticaseibacillus chiayiensis]|uniref:hypothetical protein n=1 Tax=Lacticaseibacillus chiayiensis TaxID=2100821 RepID=UPI003C7205ED